MTASAGASMVCTNVVALSLPTMSGTSAGRTMHDTSAGMKGSRSRLPITPTTRSMAAFAATWRARSSLGLPVTHFWQPAATQHPGLLCCKGAVQINTCMVKQQDTERLLTGLSVPRAVGP